MTPAEHAGQAKKFELLSKEAAKRGLNTSNLDKRAQQSREAASK